ncbi:MAG: hypothetical protein ABJL99_08330 [Aliishimia sp.]
MRLFSASVALAAGLALTACTPEPQQPVGTQIVGLPKALSLLDSICLASRPSFDGAEARMAAAGLTVKRGDRLYASDIAASANVATASGGRKICSVRATYAGDVKALQNDLAARFGRPNVRDSVGPGLLTYRRGNKGKMVLLLQPRDNNPDESVFDIALIQDL